MMALSHHLTRLRRVHAHNLTTLLRSPSSEISGALGDLGTLLPLMLALALQGSIDLPSTLVLSGLFNVATGLLFGIPLPVQPMKAIAAAAIADKASLPSTVAAGGLVGAAVLVLSVTGLLRWLTHNIPVPVVKGIQLGAGLSLVISAGGGLLRPLGWTGPSGWDNRLWALGAFVALLLTQRGGGGGGFISLGRRRGVPYALGVFVLGVAVAFVRIVTWEGGHNQNDGLGHGHVTSSHEGQQQQLPRLTPWHPHLLMPAWLDGSAVSMAVAQLPLTTLNSVVAVAALAADLGRDLELPFATPSTTSLGLSVAGMNLVGCWLGAMPVCHGAGGLAAQHRFGAQSGASIVMLGGAKVFLGLAFGSSLLGLLEAFPRSTLGVMVIAAGLELARVGASLNHGAPDLWEEVVAAGEGSISSSAGNNHNGDNDGQEAAAVAAGGILGGSRRRRRHREISVAEREERWTVMMMTTAGILAFKNDAVGFVAGLLSYGAYRLADYVGDKQQQGHGHGIHIQSESSPLLR
ncbi:hypothetical protein B0T17DRAFT_50910 [Bombardia bombarda]|uniref:Sulfate transporter n=1 Tax=Bombardia bombarda TaxID=252184 RepID=A0AA40CEL4_9PEZI|nr:hypothetical protein B0T17DRAFT_50910 [Bombardia bombarda]